MQNSTFKKLFFMRKSIFVSLFLIFSVLFAVNFEAYGAVNISKLDLSNSSYETREKFYALRDLLDEGLISYDEYDNKITELIVTLQTNMRQSTATAALDDLKNRTSPQRNVSIADAPKNGYIKYQGIDFLTFDELKSLYYEPEPHGYLKEKLYKFYRTPIISNEAYYRGVGPRSLSDPHIGPLLRVASWNIEKSMRIKEAITIFESEYELLDRIDPEKLTAFRKIDTIINQRRKLAQADIILLQEMEIGMKRSGYLNAAKELADALDMNYAYAPAYLEIDPVQLGIEKIYLDKGKLDENATDYYQENKDKFKGSFGSAVLSRYPIKNVVVHPLKFQAYDWYEGEKEKTTFLEKTKRFGGKVAFKSELTREIKHGGRNFFRVDLEVPDIPGNTLTIINIHLEIKCLPEARSKQMKEILSYIKDIKNPVVMMGDFNSAPTDLSPTSVSREVKRGAKDPTNWLKGAVTTFTGIGFVLNTTRGVTNAVKNFQNPLAADIPILAPNKVKDMFDTIENFRFSDGGAFDFRGDSKRSVNGKSGKLANSNQKDLKAFKTSFSVKRTIAYVIGKYRLDWVFVKSYLKDPLNENGPYRLAPHYGETLSELNDSLRVKVSDHNPNIIDLPFSEPKKFEKELANKGLLFFH